MPSLPAPHDNEHAQPRDSEQSSLRWRWRCAIRDDESLPWRAKLVASCSLSLHMNTSGGSCFPGIERVARECGVSHDTVQKALGELEAAGYLHVRRGGGRGRKNTYEAVLRGGTRPQRVSGLNTRSERRKHTLSASETHADSVSRRTEEKDSEKDNVKSTARIGVVHDPMRYERLRVVRCMEEMLLPILRELHDEKQVVWDGSAAVTLARLILDSPQLHEGHIAHVRDMLTGNVPDRRFSVLDVDSIENPAAFVYGLLRRQRDYDQTLPATYEALREETR